MSTQNLVKLGDVNVEIDPKSLLATLENFEKAEATTMKKLADFLTLPATPFEKRLIKPVLLGAVQNAWYEATSGGVPDQVLANQTARIDRYKLQLQEVVNNDGKDLVVPKKRTSEGGERKERASNLYRLTEATRKVWAEFKGQKRLIIRAMEALDALPGGKGCTVRQIADTVRGTDETVAPSDKNCAFHVNAFGHEGIVEKLGVDGKPEEAKSETEPTKTEPKKEAPKAPAKPTVQAPSKKK